MVLARWQYPVLRWLPALAWAAVIFTLSHSSDPPQPPRFLPINDKVAHFGLYAILSGLLYWAARGRFDPWRAALFAFCAASLYGMSDEIHQSFVPNRTPDVWDWVADVAGSSWVLVHAWFRTAIRMEPGPVPESEP